MRPTDQLQHFTMSDPCTCGIFVAVGNSVPMESLIAFRVVGSVAQQNHDVIILSEPEPQHSQMLYHSE